MYELKIALRQVSSRRRQTFFAILAVALAVSVITVMMGMLSGFQEDLINSSIENNPHIVVNAQSEGDFIHLYRYISTQIVEKKGVVAVSPKYLGQAALRHRDNAEGVSLQGIELEAFFNEPGVVSTIDVRVADPYHADMVASSIERETGLNAVSWIEANAEILKLLNTQKFFINIFYLLIYGIAGFGIANTLITIVAQRTR